MLGYVVIASRRHTDLYEWGQRSTPFNLSAEIQRRLLPAAYTYEDGSFTLASRLEPADTIGGDTFDYSLGRDQLHLSVTDAVGHGFDSALTATLCVGSLRNTRRHGATLLEQARITNAALLANGCGPDGERFATALLGRLDLRAGELELVNAGHTAPYLARDGQSACSSCPPTSRWACSRAAPVAARRSRSTPAIGSSSSRTGCWSAALPASTSRSTFDAPGSCTRAKPPASSPLVLGWHGDHGSPRRTVAGADAGPPRSEKS